MGLTGHAVTTQPTVRDTMLLSLRIPTLLALPLAWTLRAAILPAQGS